MTLTIRDAGDESVGIFPASYNVECPNFEPDEKHEMEWFRAMIITAFNEYSNGRITAMFDFEIEEMEKMSACCSSETKRFIVRYFYLATGMEGNPDEWSETVFAENEDDAKEQLVLKHYPTDIMFGPNNESSSRAFMRGCLTAYPINDTP